MVITAPIRVGRPVMSPPKHHPCRPRNSYCTSGSGSSFFLSAGRGGSCNGVHPAQLARRRRRVEHAATRRADHSDDTAHRPERLRDPADHACDVRREDRAVRPGRLGVRVVHQPHRRFHRRRRVVDGADRVPEGRALHHAVRSRRPRLLLRAAGRPLLPADGLDPVLAAAGHHPACRPGRAGYR